MVLELQPKDTRNYFMLPQAPEDAGYYVYGIPGRGAFQYAHPAMMSAILLLSRQWQAMDKRNSELETSASPVASAAPIMARIVVG